MAITTILFDAGDVLYEKPNRKAAIRDFLTARGHTPPTEGDPVEKARRLEAHAGKMPPEAFFEWLMGHYGVTDPSEVAEGVRLLRDQQQDVRFFEGVAETLLTLKRRGFRLGIVTNTFNPRSEKDVWFRSVGIDGIWDSYADSSVLHVVKPAPEIYLAALKPLGVAPGDAAFVGHAQVELDGAKALGLTTIRFNADADCARSDHAIERFADLPNVPPLAAAARA